MKQVWILTVMLCLRVWIAFGQQDEYLRGRLTIDAGDPLIGATVLWKGTQTATTTDTAGRFQISKLPTVGVLTIRYLGLDDLEVEILPVEQDVWIEVKDLPAQVLQEVQVRARQFGSSVSLLTNQNVESMNTAELRKAPCCNLSESFETNNTVDVAYPNPITGVREVQMLGLRSAYSNFLIENRPAMRGIAAPYAFDYLPGTWLSGIQLAKGAGTVVNGSEGITGQINIDIQRPDRDKPLFFNAFANTGNRYEANLHLNKKGKKAISHGLLTHGSLQRSPFDHNGDNFYDMLDREQLNGMYRMTYESDAWCGKLTVHALTDTRQGGQIKPSTDGRRFAFDMQNDRVELSGKMGRTGLGNKPYRELGNIAQISHHKTHGTIGVNTYTAEQNSVFLQSIYKTIVFNTNHKIEMAPTLSADLVTEQLNTVRFDRKEWVAGAMAEYVYSRPNLKSNDTDMAVVLGLRTDYNSLFGILVAPRVSFRYNPNNRTVVRASAGRGFHSPFVLAENISWLATNKTVYFAQVTHAEAAWNYGANLTQKFQISTCAANWTIDLYRTDFTRQLLIDQETATDTVRAYYTTAPSWSQSVMLSFQLELMRGLDLKLATKFQDVQATYADGVRRWIPMLPRHRSLASLDYTSRNEKWKLNTTLHLVGTQRLPDNEGIPHLHGSFPERTPVYPLLQAQLTHRFKRFEVYLGGENLTGYTQHHLIIAADRPESKYFNASQVWAPSFGRMGYLGIRFSSE